MSIHNDNKLERGNKLWELKFMLPEQKQALLRQRELQRKVKKPILDEQAWQEIGIVAMDSLNYELPVRLTYWSDGEFMQVFGIVDRIDKQLKQLKMKINEECLYIQTDCITAIERDDFNRVSPYETGL